MQVKIESSWLEVLKNEFTKPYFIQLADFIREEYKNHIIYPKGKDIFAAFDYTPFTKTKVVIVGQDPYHNEGQAHGLSFSVKDCPKLPPSLKNIFKELTTDIGNVTTADGNLDKWAQQGVLLLNATLTVRAHNPGSHQNKGWETFTDTVIEKLNSEKESLVFILWGAYAQKKGQIIDKNKHLVIESAHPSPFSADKGFYGSRPFSRANDFLVSKGFDKIVW